MRVLGVDYGERRIGLALSDPTGTFAQPLQVITWRRRLREPLAAIEAVCREREVEEVVVGMPFSMSGEVGTKAREVRNFLGALRGRLDVPVREWDERLSTVAAERALIEGNVRREKRKKLIDKTAAALILGGYLDYRKSHPRSEEEE